MNIANSQIESREVGAPGGVRLFSLRLVLASAVLLLTQLGIYLIDQGFRPLPPVMPEWKLSGFPRQLGLWKGTETPIDERIFEKSQAASMVNRIYKNPLIGDVLVHLAIWDNYQLTLPHSPQECYKSAGWQVAQNRDIRIPETESQSFLARMIKFERQEERIVVLFWYELGESVVIDRHELRSFMQKARMHDSRLPVIFKSMLQTRDDGSAEDRLREMAVLVRSNMLTIGRKDR